MLKPQSKIPGAELFFDAHFTPLNTFKSKNIYPTKIAIIIDSTPDSSLPTKSLESSSIISDSLVAVGIVVGVTVAAVRRFLNMVLSMVVGV